jgi:hypothetical protein
MEIGTPSDGTAGKRELRLEGNGMRRREWIAYASIEAGEEPI